MHRCVTVLRKAYDPTRTRTCRHRGDFGATYKLQQPEGIQLESRFDHSKNDLLFAQIGLDWPADFLRVCIFFCAASGPYGEVVTPFDHLRSP